MKILLDTNALLWWFVGDSRLSARALAALDEAVEVYFSMVNLWEAGLKMGKGGYDFPMPADWEVALPAFAEKFDVKETTFGARHCKLIETLPFHHKNPFDRMIIAQALIEGLEVVSSDEKFEKYGVERIW